MPIIRKNVCSELPDEFMQQVCETTRLKVTRDYYDDKYDKSRRSLLSSLESPDSPVCVRLGERGGSPKIPGVCQLILYERQDVDHSLVHDAVAQMVAKGEMTVRELLAIVKSYDVRVLAEHYPDIYEAAKTDPKVVLSVREDPGFAASVVEELERPATMVAIATSKAKKPKAKAERPKARRWAPLEQITASK